MCEKKKAELIKVTENITNAFQWTEYDTGKINEAHHEICTGDAWPIRPKQFRLQQTAQQEVSK